MSLPNGGYPFFMCWPNLFSYVAASNYNGDRLTSLHVKGALQLLSNRHM